MSTPRKQASLQVMTPSRRRNTPLVKTPRNVSNHEGEGEGITVAIRMRPLNTKEKSERRIWKVLPKFQSVTQTTANGRPLQERVMNRNFFTFDKTFGEESNTRDVYDSIAKGIVDSVVSGLNGTIFAYGQTSSGKTYTMQGSGSIEEGSINGKGGVVHMAAQDIFSYISQKTDRVFLVRVSFVEIYNEEVRDLLDSNNILQIREDPRRGVFVNSQEVVATDFSSLLQNLFQGERNRAVAATGMNERSSRSHTIFRITIESRDKESENANDEDDDCEHEGAVRISTLNLVDLAGSESVRHTGNTGDRLKEGAKINLSLMTLSRVIAALGQSNNHVNYRDSKLTRILQPSLSGNARMAIVCCATPSELYFEDTRSTLMFASRAKLVKTNAQVNEVLDDQSLIKRLQKELAEAKKRSNGCQQTEQLRALETQAANAGKERREVEEKLRRLQRSILNSSTIFESTHDNETKGKSTFLQHRKRRLSDGGLNLKISSPISLLKPRAETPKTAPDGRKIRRKLLNNELSSEEEISLVRKAVAAKGAKLRSLEDDVIEKSKMLATSESNLRDTVFEKDALNDSLMQSNVQRNEYNNKVKELTTQLDVVQSSKRETEEKAKNFEEELKVYKEESEQLITNLEMEKENLQVSLKDLEMNTNLSLQTLRDEHSECLAKIKELTTHIELEKSKKHESDEKVVNLEQELKVYKEGSEELINVLEVEKKNLQASLADLKNESDSSLAALRETCDSLTSKVCEAEREEQESNKKETALAEENARLTSEIARLTSEVDIIKNEREEDKEKIQTLNGELSLLTIANKDCTEENEELKNKLTIEVDKFQDASKAKNDAQAEVEELSQNIKASHVTINELTTKSEHTEKEIESARELISGKDAELRSISEALEIEEGKSMTLTNEVEKISEENSILHQSVTELQQECSNYKGELENLRETVQLGEEERKVVTAEAKNTVEENEAIKREIENLQQHSNEISLKYEEDKSIMMARIEELTKERDMANSAVETMKDELKTTTESKEELNKQMLAWSGKAEEQEQEIENLRSQIMSLRADFQLENSKLEEEKAELKKEYESLNENLSDLQTRSNQTLATQKEKDSSVIARLTEDQNEAKTCIANLTEELRTITASKEEITAQFSILNNQVHEQEKEIESLGSQLMVTRADFQLEYSKLEEEKAELSLELDNLEKERDEVKADNSTLQVALAKMESENALNKKCIEDAGEKYNQSQSLIEEKNKVIAAAESEKLILQAQTEANETKLNDQENLISKLQNECADREKQLEEAFSLKNSTEESLVNANSDLDLLRSDLEEKTNLLLKADHQRSQLQDQMSILESQSRDLELLIERVRRELTDCEAALEQTNTSKQLAEEELVRSQSEVNRLNSIIDEKTMHLDESRSIGLQLQEQIREFETTICNQATLVETLKTELIARELELKENTCLKDTIDEDLACARSDVELMRSEIAEKVESLNSAERKNNELQDQISKLMEEANHLKNELDEGQAAREIEMNELNRSKVSVDKELECKTSEILLLQDDIKNKVSILNQSESKILELTQQVAVYEARLCDQEVCLKNLQNESIDREMKLTDITTAKQFVEESLANAKSDIEMLHLELAEKIDMLSKEQSRNIGLQDQIATREIDLQALNDSNASLSKDLESVTSKMVLLQEDTERKTCLLSQFESKISDLTQQIAMHEENLANVKSDTEILKLEFAENNDMLRMEQNRNNELQDQIVASTEESDSVKNENKGLKEQIALFHSQADSTEDLINSNNICQEKLAFANDEIEKLRKEISEKIESLLEAEQENQRFKEQIAVFENKVVDLETELQSTTVSIQEEVSLAKSKIKDLQLDVTEKNNLLANSTSEVEKLRLLIAEKDECLSQSGKDNEDANEEMKKKTISLEAEKVELIELLASANQSVKEAREAALAADDELEMKERKLEEIVNQFTICEEELKQQNDQVIDLQRQLNSAQQVDSSSHGVLLRLEQLSEKKAKLEDLLLKERADRDKWEEAHKRRMGEEQRLLVKEGERAMSSIRNERDQLKSALSQCESQICTIEKEKEDLMLEKKQLELDLNEMPKLNSELSQIRSTLFNLKVENKNLLSKVKSMSGEQSFRKSKEDEEIAKLTAELNRSKAEIYEARQTNMELQDIRKKLKLEQGKLSAKLQLEINNKLAAEACLQENEKEIQNLKSQKSSTEALQKQQNTINILMNDIKNKDTRIEKLEKVRLTKEKCAVLKKLKEDHKRFQEENKSYKKKLALAQQELSALRSASATSKTEQSGEHDTALKFEKEALETKLKKYIKYCKRLESDKTQIIDALRSHKRDVIDDDFSGAVVSLCDQLTSLEEECDALSSAEGKASSYLVEIENFREEIKALQGIVNQLKSANADATEKLNKMETKNMQLREERNSLRNRGSAETEKPGQVKYLEQENLQLILDLKTTKKQLQSTQAKLEAFQMKALDSDDTDDFSVFTSSRVSQGVPVSQSPFTDISSSVFADKENKMNRTPLPRPGKQTGIVGAQSSEKKLRPNNFQRPVGLGEAGDLNDDNTQECRQS